MKDTLGKYELLGLLGEGAMGRVYRARDTTLDRLVALKTISTQLLSEDDVRARFEREARAAARLQHPCIVTIYELGESQGQLFIAMELLAGADLTQMMTPPGRVPVAGKVRTMADVCRGLDFAHKRGVVHRDVKPANVRVLEDGTVRLLDFGIAHLADSSMTRTGLALGTPSYMAPEMLRSGHVDHRADMWAVGVILYEWLAGRRPFDAPTVASLAYQIVHEPLPPLESVARDLPEGLADLVNRSLTKEPEGRFPDMAAMEWALRQIVDPQVARTSTQPFDPRILINPLVAEARGLMATNDFKAAQHIAMRAQAIAPGHPEVKAILTSIEQSLADVPTIAAAPAASVARSTASAGATLRLQTLRARGSATLEDRGLFGSAPGTTALALAPDATSLALCGADGAVRIWDLRARTLLATLRSELHLRSGHDALGRALAFSPDGKLLATAHVDGLVHLWDVAERCELPVRLRHDGPVSGLAFSPRGETLATGSQDSSVRLWNVAAARRGEARRELLRQPSPVTALAYSAEGSRLFCGHINRLVRVLDTNTLRLRATLRGAEAAVQLLSLVPDGTHLVVGTQDRRVRLVDTASLSWQGSLECPRRPAQAIAFADAGRIGLTVSQDNALTLWDLERQAPAASLWGDPDEVFVGVVHVESAGELVVGLGDGRLRAWRTAP
jgi:serine/threonine protein kinase/WD40 repeat protein